MIIYRKTKRTDSAGNEEWRGQSVALNSLEPPSAQESSLITPQPTGHGGVLIPCFAKGLGDTVRYSVELTRRDLLAACEAAGLQVLA